MAVTSVSRISCPRSVLVRRSSRATARLHAPAFRGHRAQRRGVLLCHAGVGLFFSTSTGHTEDVASLIKEELGEGSTDPQEIADADLSSLSGYDGLIVGAPTWNTGADTERSGTGWDNLLDDIRGLDLGGTPVAVFGLGDSVSYADNFADAMEEIHDVFKDAGAKMVGYWPTEGYQHAESKALVDDATFCGLPLDEDNEDDKTLERVKAWVGQLKGEMSL